VKKVKLSLSDWLIIASILLALCGSFEPLSENQWAILPW